MNNIRYIAWAETARIALLPAVGMSTLPGDPVGPILARIENDYLEPVEYPARVTIGMRASGWGTAASPSSTRSGIPARQTGSWHGGGRWWC